MARAARPKDAIALLKADHRTVEDLFEKFENARGAASKKKIAAQVCMELIVHAQIEEEIFYPAVKDALDTETYTEAYVEHDGAKMLIAELMAAEDADEFFEAKVKVLSEMIKHHVREEEQRDGMFAQAKKGDVDLADLGEQLMARKTELTATYKSQGLPTPVTRSLVGAKLKFSQPVA